MGYMQSKVGKGDSIYTPINKNKFMGRDGFAVCRSSWETAVCRWLDMNQAVLQWDSEPLAIPYIDPTTTDHRGIPKKRRYFPDFLAKICSKSGELVIWLIEVKPHKETIQPRNTGKKSKKTQIYEQTTWARNSAKWRAAECYCNSKKWKFKILTEKFIIS